MIVLNKKTDIITNNSVYVGRPSKWGNPWSVGKLSREKVLSLYKEYVIKKLEEEPTWLDELKGKDLVCWCAPLPCHADILIELIKENYK